MDTKTTVRAGKQRRRNTFVWIPSHIGITGNEKADDLAKNGSEQGRLLHTELGITEINSLIKKKIKEK